MPRLPRRSRDILNYRPNIDYVEPDLDTTPDIRPTVGDPNANQIEDIELSRKQLRNLAASVRTLAAVTQARVDQKAKDFEVDLDPTVDAPTIAAMRRQFPDEDPNKITYSQYRASKQLLYDRGKKVGERALITPNDVDKADPNALGGFNKTKGDFDTSLIETDKELEDQLGNTDPKGSTEEGTGGAGGVVTDSTEPGIHLSAARAESGGLRPELDKRTQIIEPIQIDEFQNLLLRILVNTIWRTFIRPALPKIPGVKWPKRICKLPSGYTDTLMSIPGLSVLGGDSPKQAIPSIPTSLDNLL